MTLSRPLSVPPLLSLWPRPPGSAGRPSASTPAASLCEQPSVYHAHDPSCAAAEREREREGRREGKGGERECVYV